MESVEELVNELGGKITNRYKLIKGFSMEFDDSYLNILKNQIERLNMNMDGRYHINLEEDQIVHANTVR
ncbi:uncharacterized protein NDAI_0B04560 [Naumovozyma dairenensis CBS 421]|uniref:Inhibitor I9 domain-containing protein n=1 Tax=Naumovozyma dairenensis (strain ATCC 10597 / BCRC 20456 / CBS 421 / NBRC 0211 / NRRL Y-12639) TaxID=1071378 RepID=G0W6T0_NAUDC|nr:hypothetical protein NDAI_0B04560 [Naumovozyma dairenensis CBS 421]CCD23491.1 hypothetical protein NDAI_0B04560 [Naumovozyma dairenensis CBS 421]